MQAPTTHSARSTEPPRLPIRHPRTLLVEDEFKALRRRRDLLRMKDLDVISASSKEEALDRLKAIEFRVDVVLTDLNLTADSGARDAVEVAQAVAEHWSGASRFTLTVGRFMTCPNPHATCSRTLS